MAQFSQVFVYPYLELDALGPYVEESLHRPDPSVLRGITGIISEIKDFWRDVTPRAGEEYSVMELPTPGVRPGSEAWDEGKDIVYRFLAAELASGGRWIYGWIDDVKVKIQKGEKRSIVIRWHPDWFLTLGATASYGAGRLLRGPETFARPDPSTPVKWLPDTRYDLVTDADHPTPWVIIVTAYTDNSGQDPITHDRIYFWQIGEPIIYNSQTYYTMGIGFLYAGSFDEFLALDATKIRGVYISPCQPFDIIGAPHVGNLNMAAWKIDSYNNYVVSTLFSSATKISTNDRKKITVTDPYGGTIISLPWGMEFDNIRAHVDITPNSGNLILAFRDGNSDSDAYNKGMLHSIPLLNVPVSSNAFSEYQYSGQREFDITTKRLQQQQVLESGIANATQSAASGAMMGSIGGGTGGPIGAFGGALLGYASAIGSAYSNYGITGKYDRLNQKAVDQLMSKQVSNLLISGGGIGWYNNSDNPGVWRLNVLKRDPSSLAVIDAEQEELGCVTEAYIPDCTTIINGGGGLRIDSLEVVGVNTSAAKYISSLFSRGIHIDPDPL